MQNLATKILDDDTAYEVAHEYRLAREEGLSPELAASQVLKTMDDALSDLDEGPVVYLVLAYLLHQDGSIVPSIRDHAISIIVDGIGLDRWKEVGETHLNERKLVLNALLMELENNHEKK